MVGKLLNLLHGDLRKPWSPWTKVCVIGCGSSLAVLKSKDNLFARNGELGVADFLGLCTLALCLVAGVVALARNGTSRTVPVIALFATLFIGSKEALLASFALVDAPLVLLGKFIEHPLVFLVFSFCLILFAALLAIGSQALKLDGSLLALVKWGQKEWQRRVNKLSVIGAIAGVAVAIFLKQEGLSFFLYGLIFRKLSWLLLRCFFLGATLVASFFLAMRPFWRGEENRFPSVLTIILFSL